MTDLTDNLDVGFYKAFYADLKFMTDQEAATHWTECGLEERRIPNFAAYLATKPPLAAELPERFAALDYRYLNPDLRDVIHNDWQAAVHYLEEGRQQGRTCVVDMSDTLPVVAPAKAGQRAARRYRNLEDLLRRNGILSAGFIADLNVQDYIVLNGGALNGGAGLSTTMQCVRHFAEQGRAALCPLAFDWRFDAAFYAEMMPAAPADPPQAYLHWLNVGREAAVKPNPELVLKSLGLRNLAGSPGGFDARSYVALNPDIARQCRTSWDALGHLINAGIVDRRDGCPEPKEACDIYLAAADRLAIANRLTDARWVYELLLSAHPGNGFALRHYGDCLYRMGDHYAAVQAYQRALELGRGNVWTYINLAACFEKTGQFEAAAEVLLTLRGRMPGDVGIARRADAAAGRNFEQKSHQASRLACSGLLEAGRLRMLQAATALARPVLARRPGPVVARRPIKAIAIVADLSLPQCRFYRIEQKLEHLKAGGIAARVFDHTADLQNFASCLPFVDAVIFYRVPAFPAVVKAIEATRLAGLPSFYEIDDVIFDERYFPDSFDSYGGQISHEVYAGLVTGTGLFRTAMSMCDYALASTPALADLMQHHVVSGRAFVHRNALSSPHLQWMDRQRKPPSAGPVTLFYGTGTRAHNEDFDTILAPTLARLLQTYGDRLKLVIMGYLSLPACLKPFAGQIALFDTVWDLQIYWSTLSQMDINLAVLKPGMAFDCKSEIKWLEAAMLGIPSVVSRTRTYAEVIEDGVDGMLASTPAEFFNALDLLIGDPARRQRMGAAAWRHARASYGPDAAAQNIAAIMRDVTRPGVGGQAAAKRRVLIVNVYFPPQAIGGATRVVADNVTDLMASHGHALELEIFTTTEGGEVPYARTSYEYNGIKVTAITASDHPKVDHCADDPKMATAFGDYLDHFKPDVIHFHCIQRLTGAVCRAAKQRGIPYFVTVHDGWWISDSQFLLDENLKLSVYNYADPARQLAQGGPQSLHRMQALAENLRGAERVLAVSEPFARIYRDCGFERVEVLENGVSGLTVLPRTRSPDGRVRLAHVGGAAPHKGYDLLRAALVTSSFTNLALTVLDHALLPGEEREDLWGTTPVRFQARVAQAEVGELYARTDVVLAPSIWPESYGLVVREALQAGCWVIASDRGALAADVTPGNGFVVDVEGVGALRAVLGKIDADPQRYLGPIEPCGEMRSSTQQAVEIATLYRAEGRKAARAVTPLRARASR
jgi:glycosyltransferase involved in cell wall biosynthesis/tetratricopeptide (TPR) repeat protein